jgi:hypothetical protein
MGLLQERMIEALTLRGSAPNTTSAYVRSASAFVAFHRRSPTELGEEQVRAVAPSADEEAPQPAHAQ